MTNDKQRERLVELIESHKYWCVPDELADYLLANGVIVPPVGIGQKVYRTSGNFRGEKIYEGVVDQIIAYDDRETRFYVYGHPLSFVECNIGKTVFLTKEEAEQALNNIQNGNGCEGGAE